MYLWFKWIMERCYPHLRWYFCDGDDEDDDGDCDACEEDGSVDDNDKSENGFSFELSPQFSSQAPFAQVGQRGHLKMFNHLDFQVRYFMLMLMPMLMLMLML